jgi:hypothetical protein
MHSSSQNFDDVCVVVRECGERTANACCDLLAEALGSSVIHRVSGRPFALTLRRALEHGASVGCNWTLCIDADVLVVPQLGEFICKARSLPQDTFAIQALVFDKLLPTRRPAGNHLYRTEQISRALSLIPNGDVLRPETVMIQRMRDLGHKFFQLQHVIGLHDFEQSYEDIFAKAYLHGHKHRMLKDDYLPIWEVLAENDQDYLVALAAWRCAEGEQNLPQVSRDYTEALMRNQGVVFEAKPALTSLAMADTVSLMFRVAAPDPRIDQWRGHLQNKIDASVFPHIPSFKFWLRRKFQNLKKRLSNLEIFRFRY